MSVLQKTSNSFIDHQYRALQNVILYTTKKSRIWWVLKMLIQLLNLTLNVEIKSVTLQLIKRLTTVK